MKLTAKFKIAPTEAQEILINKTMMEYIKTVNNILTDMIDYDQRSRFSSKMINADIPSCLKTQAAGDACSINRKMIKHKTRQPVLRKPCAIWNNQNFTVRENSLSFPVNIDGKSKRITVEALIPSDVFSLLQNAKHGTMRITKKGNKYIAQIAYEAISAFNENTEVMGVDLGLKCPAVSFSAGKVKFFGNGRKNKYTRRRFHSTRKKLQKAKKPNAIKKSKNKERRIMTDIDHKLSREIVNYAYDNGVKVIKLETLKSIRKKTSKSRKNNRALHSWSFYRLQQFIKYKAELLDIEVEEINPTNTSKKCPNCGKLNNAHDRLYSCDCGYKGHRDLVGAINICNA